MSSKRKLTGIILSFILFGGVCFKIGTVYSNGGNPTIDPTSGEGLSGFSWYNASIGVYAPEFWHEDLGNYTAWIESIEGGGGGVTDHGALTGLGDDDHNLYLLQSGVEGLTGNWDIGNYDLTAKYMTADEFYRTGLGNYSAWIESLVSISDHGDLTGLTDDDHPQYLLQDGSEVADGIQTNWIELDGDNRTTWPSGGGVTDHGDLTGLTDDDHEQYLLDSLHTKAAHDALSLDHGFLSGLTDDDHSAYVDKDGEEGLTGDWDVGNYEITTDGLTSPWLDLGGDNRTVWPSGSGNASPGYYDIIIQVDSGTYTATHCNGTELWSSSDAESVFYNSNAFFGGNPGHIKFGTGTFDFDDTLHPSSFIAVSGMGKSQTELRPADDSVIPLIALDEHQGEANRQEYVRLEDFTIDLRQFAGSVGIEIYNLKCSVIRNVDIQYFRLYGMFFDADNSQYSMALWIENIFLESTSGTAGIWLDGGDGVLDSWFINIWGQLPGVTHGFYAESAGNLRINDMHMCRSDHAFTLNPNGGGRGGVTYNLHFNRPVADWITGNAWWLDLDSGSAKYITIAYPHFINTPDNFDLFEIDVAGTSKSRFQIYGATHSGFEDFEWIMDCNDQSYLVDWTISHMKMPAGDTGAYNGIPTHFITDDIAYTNSSYQIDAGAWSNPIWVGTPYDGWTVRMYNADTAPYYRIYTYVNGGWHYFDATG